MHQIHALIYVYTDFTIPGAESLSGVQPGTGWVGSKMYPGVVDVAGSGFNEVTSDLVGDLRAYYGDYMVITRHLSDDYPSGMTATLFAGINSDGRVEPMYIMLDREWDDIQMIVEEEFFSLLA